MLKPYVARSSDLVVLFFERSLISGQYKMQTADWVQNNADYGLPALRIKFVSHLIRDNVSSENLPGVMHSHFRSHLP